MRFVSSSSRLVVSFLLVLWGAELLSAADNLKLNPHLDYSSDSQNGPLITGDNLEAGLASGKTNYIIIYGEGCFNSKRQARRTVELYTRYKDKVNFVVIDLDLPHSGEQQQLMKRFYRGYIPHVVVIGKRGNTLYDSAGEVSSNEMEKIFERSLNSE